MDLKYGDKLQNKLGIWFYHNPNNKNKRVYHSFRFRVDSVPFIGKTSNVSCFKKPKTTQERKYSFCDQCKEYNIKVRKRRNFKNLPNTWDDIYKYFPGKSWKHQTKKRKQWG